MATAMSLKLVVDKEVNKVLFAEAGKDFVDFLFSLFTLPLGTMVKLLSPTQTMAPGSIGNLYSSVDNLDKLYIKPKMDKSLLLQPKIYSGGNDQARKLLSSEGNSIKLLSSEGNSIYRKSKSKKPTKQPIYYRCADITGSLYCGNNGGVSFGAPFTSTGITLHCKNYRTNVKGTPCGCCGVKMVTDENSIAGESGGGGDGDGDGYAKEGVTYMITDDLEVKPMSAISSITFLKRYEIKDLGNLEDRVVHLSKEKGLDLLRASLQSKSVLTDVFLLAKKRVKMES